MHDLFTDDLSKLTLSDVTDFLGLNGPEDLRPTEGTRIDFKRELRPEIGATVSAFANTFGGLIFVGVQSSKHTKPRQNVALSAPGTPLGPDARARITGLIVSTVNPRPRFEVQPYGTDSAGNMVAVVRVEDGTNPPYEYERTGDYQIPVRVQDTTRQASLREIEDLLAKRSALRVGVDERIGLYLRDSDSPGLTASQRMLIVPHSTLRVRLDGAFERRFVEIVGTAGRTNRHSISRKGAYSLLRSDHRTLGIWNSGAMVFVANLSRRGYPGEYVGDLIDDLLGFMKVAAREYAALGYAGSFVLLHTLRPGPVVLLPKFASAAADYPLQAVRLPASPPGGAVGMSEFRCEIDCDELADPTHLVSELMLHQLRETWEADIDFDKLLLEVRAR
jgi:hypothetical protein